MPATITAGEEAQLQQTIEMFEVITQSQPQDYQSLEILKEAYFKLGRPKDVVNTSKRIAEAYVQLGQLSSAIMEYETILQRYPDDPDVKKALEEIENRANSFAAKPAGEAVATSPGTSLKTKDAAAGKPGAAVEDGKAVMQKIFVDGKLITAGDFNHYWQTPDSDPGQVVEPFLQVMADKGVVPLDKSVKLICERSRLGYIPLEKYDVDMELARSFPKGSCQRWCVLPFDRMSKTVMVATTNPFNQSAASELQAATPYRLLWYVASPPELVKALKKVFR
jgi:tetratricopeptide (TPR) repeat protein